VTVPVTNASGGSTTVWRRAQSYVNAVAPWVPSVRVAMVLVSAVYV
jgi:hypothetical protein